MTSINPATGTSGDNIQIHGTGFSQRSRENYVLIGDSACAVYSSSNTVIGCTLGASFAGPKSLYVHVLSSGIAETSGVIFNYTLLLTSVSPSGGSRAGDTEITIAGSGFYTNESSERQTSPVEDLATLYLANTLLQQCRSGWENQVTVGSNPCRVSSSTANSLTCLTPTETGTASHYDITVSLHCIDTGEEVSNATIPDAFNYVDAFTPNIDSVMPLEGIIQGGDTVTITGTGFSDDRSHNQVLVRNTIIISG